MKLLKNTNTSAEVGIFKDVAVYKNFQIVILIVHHFT